MILELVLGKNLDTTYWIQDLKEMDAENIAVLDYDFVGDYEVMESIKYMSAEYALSYVRKFDSVNYYKSLYVYPGMSGSMSSLKRRD